MQVYLVIRVMNQQEAWKLWEVNKPCFYTGKQQHLWNVPLYIKEVTKKSAIVNFSPEPRDYQNTRCVRLKNLVSRRKLNMKKAIA